MTAIRGYEALEDPALVALVVEGDGSALEALFARYGRVSYALARRILADEEQARSVVRDVFLTVWRDAGRHDATRGGCPAWLVNLTQHAAVEVVRRDERLRRRRTAGESLDFAQLDIEPMDVEVWSGLRRDGVRAALQALPAAQAEAVALAYFGGYTQREIAQLTEAPLATVKARMLAGMRRLRDVLDDTVAGP